MFDYSQLIIFISASVLLIIIPGPAVLYIIARSMDQGRTAGMLSVLGIGIGTVIHITAAALGLTAILITSSAAFQVVKYIGAAYLIFLGIKRILEKDDIPDENINGAKSKSKVFYQAILVNLLNPKLAIFFFTFLPQFVDVNRGNSEIQIIVLGLILLSIGLVSDSIYALIAGTVSGWIKKSLRFKKILRYTSSGTYIVLGIIAAAYNIEKN